MDFNRGKTLMTRILLMLLVVAGVTIIPVSNCRAAAATYDDKARAVAAKAIAARDAMKTIYMEVQTTVSRPSGAEYISTQVWFTRPDRALLVKRSGDIAITTYLNKSEYIAYNHPPRNDYLRKKRDTSLMAAIAVFGNVVPVAAALYFSDLPNLLLKDQAVTYAGQEIVAGVPCHVLSTSSERGHTKYYFDANGVLRRSLLTGERGTVAGISSDSVYKLVANRAIPDKTYSFTPPPGAKEMASGGSSLAKSQ
jgi:outer membrane lipoprotein-sorting protein